MMDSLLKTYHFKKLERTIESCRTYEQLEITKDWLEKVRNKLTPKQFLLLNELVFLKQGDIRESCVSDKAHLRLLQ